MDKIYVHAGYMLQGKWNANGPRGCMDNDIWWTDILINKFD